MNKHLWEKRIPTIPALLILIVSIFVSSFVIQKGVFFIGKASPDTTPHSIKITNVTDTTFTVTFSTIEKSVGAVTLSGKNELTSLIYDDRDKPTGKQNNYYSHSITVPNLKPSTLYYFTILSNSNKYLSNGQPFLIKTGPAITTTPPNQKPLYGKIILPDGSAGEDVLLYATFPNGQAISAVSKKTGEYIIPANSVRTTQLNAYLELENNTPITITAVRQNFSSTISILYKNGEQIPAVNLSQNYNFSQAIAPQIVSTESALLTIPQINSQAGTIKIIVPQKSQSFSDKQPLFQGLALPNKSVKITIPEAKVETSIKSDKNGFWSLRPSSPLKPGQYTFQMETPDSIGITTKLAQPFSIFASGSQLALEEVPSQAPSPTPTISPTSKPTPSSTPVPSAIPTLSPTPLQASLTPTLSPDPSLTPSITITMTPTPLPTNSPTPTQIQVLATPTSVPVVTLAKPGSSSSFILTTISIAFIVSGAFLLFLL